MCKYLSLFQIISSDIDECVLGTDNCDENAACTNTAGSFTCACNTGYSGDGVTCTGKIYIQGVFKLKLTKNHS